MKISKDYTTFFNSTTVWVAVCSYKFQMLYTCTQGFQKCIKILCFEVDISKLKSRQLWQVSLCSASWLLWNDKSNLSNENKYLVELKQSPDCFEAPYSATVLCHSLFKICAKINQCELGLTFQLSLLRSFLTCVSIHCYPHSTVKPRLSGLVGTSVNSPDNRESG